MKRSSRVVTFLCMVLIVGSAQLAVPARGEASEEGGGGQCTIDFDTVCPDTARVCRTRVRGGSGCVIDGLPFCYDSGSFSYRVDAGDRAEFVIRGRGAASDGVGAAGDGVSDVEVFFGQAGPGAGGVMTFFDIDGLQVGDPITTNGICSDAMPPTQSVSFATPVVRIRVRAIDTDVYVDSLTLTRAPAQ